MNKRERPLIHTREQVLSRFLPKIEIDDGCWNWIGCKISKGYGQLLRDGKMQLAHRLSYELFVGDIGVDKNICHHCDNPSCIRPSHLFQGTSKENSQDMARKNRCSLQGDRHPYRRNPELALRGDKNPKTKLTVENVVTIRNLIGTMAKRRIATRFHVDKNTITLIERRITWAHVQ